jgi:uncharacterized protein (TIGR04255 family)
MSINEIFPNPTAKQVVFQIRYPNLFYIENKIGDLQAKIMGVFPNSSLILRRQIVLADIGSELKPVEIPIDLEKEVVRKIWQFKSDKNYKVNVQTNSLTISSEYHKTYNLDGADKFRDVIKFILDNFFDVISIPIINRIGFRYIDECPLPKKDNSTFKSYYNSVFPIERFNLTDVDEMDFKTVIKKGKYFLRYIEALKIKDEKSLLVLDYDAFAINIQAKDYLEVTDHLHSIIIEEYEKTIKDPVYEYMRKQKEG